MTFSLRENGRTTFHVDPLDVENALELRLKTQEIERLIDKMGDNASATVSVIQSVPVYTSPSRLRWRQADVYGQLDGEVLFLCLFDSDPEPDSMVDPTAGCIFFVEQTDEGWVVGNHWYWFNDNSHDQIGRRELGLIYAGTLPEMRAETETEE